MLFQTIYYPQELMLKTAEAWTNAAKLASIYSSIYFRTYHETIKQSDKPDDFYEKWLRLMDDEFDRTLRTDDFMSLLSKYVNSLVDLRTIFRKAGYPVDYFDKLFDEQVRRMMVFSSIPKETALTPFDVVHVEGKTRLLHYHNNKTYAAANNGGSTRPLLIIYAPINRFHIMDLNPDRSVVKELLSKGLDVYLLDWGYPDWSDDKLSVNDYLEYVDHAVRDITATTGLDKVSILGYCWGGIFAVAYTALNNQKVKNLTVMATPVDFSKDSSILAVWAKALDSDKIVEEFGHMDGQVLDLGFILRNPPRYTFDKYLKLSKKLHDARFVDTFIAVEKWLYDTPSIPGNLYRQIVDDCYKKNLLIRPNQMEVGGKQIDLGKIDVPLLTVVAERDDLVSRESSLALKDHVSSKVKESLEIPGGHVGLCVSTRAHEKLWPDVAEFILLN